MILTFKITTKNRLKKYFRTPTGFELGTSRVMGPACYQNTMILLLHKKSNLFHRFFHKIFPNKEATKHKAKAKHL